jgi:hypothetical protein
MHIVFLRDIQKERYRWDELDVDGWIILKWIIREIGLGGMDWIWIRIGISGRLL